MILTPSPPFLARWCAGVSRTTSAMRVADVVGFAGVACVGVVASVILVPGWGGVWGAGLAVLRAAIAVVDARRFIIPDELTVAALALGLAYATVEEPDIWCGPRRVGVARYHLAFLGVRAVYAIARPRGSGLATSSSPVSPASGSTGRLFRSPSRSRACGAWGLPDPTFLFPPRRQSDHANAVRCSWRPISWLETMLPIPFGLHILRGHAGGGAMPMTRTEIETHRRPRSMMRIVALTSQ
jgi:hypothetical protein